ncbi:rhodanese-like domain-containing protein [Veronia pacifica]|uniref:Rhodanese domain-containing protein n=1 Tax=Veronia pacifica TaxID=1080227 RepID=A0A1C3EC64_9GAMM|nr:rhodanese-like domain-containing protein [Veronia pacifica]ODA30832.1 hypothetical protein A8L45_19140 [Veronia pacifica]
MLLTSNEIVEKAKVRIKEVDAQDFLLNMDKYVVIDVREKNELDDGYIDGSVHIPRGTLEMNILKLLSDTLKVTNIEHQPIMLYCRTGARSALSADALQGMGFKEVYSLAGGFKKWQELDYPTVSKK